MTSAPGIEDDLARGGQQRALLAALDTLNERDRALLLLHYWDGLAVVLELSSVLVRTRLHRAVLRMRHTVTAEFEREDPRSPSVELTET